MKNYYFLTLYLRLCFIYLKVLLYLPSGLNNPFFFFILSPQVMLSKPQVIIDFPQLLQIFYERCA